MGNRHPGQRLIAGIGAAVEYIAGVGRRSSPAAKTRMEPRWGPHAARSPTPERLIARLIESLQAIPSVHIYGITAPNRFDERFSTLSLPHVEDHPKTIAD